MAIQISGTTVINNSRKGLFATVNPGTYSTRPSAVAGDIIYNTSTGKLEYYTGSAWVAAS